MAVYQLLGEGQELGRSSLIGLIFSKLLFGTAVLSSGNAPIRISILEAIPIGFGIEDFNLMEGRIISV